MKKLIALVIFSLLCFHVNAQNNFRKIDDLMENLSFKKAIQLLERRESVAQTSQTVSRLAVCYWKVKEYEKAHEYFLKSLHFNPDDERLKLLVAESEETLQHYDLAGQAYKTLHAGTVVSEKELREIKDANSHWRDLMQSNQSVKVESWEGNSSYNDFSPRIYGDRFMYASSKSTRNRKRYQWDGQSYCNLFSSNEVGIFRAINSSSHEASFSIDPSNGDIYFTRTVFNSNADANYLQIQVSSWNGNYWGDPKPFKHNLMSCNNGHPSISPSGNMLVFVSDRTAGRGEADIYVCYRTNDEWSAPKPIEAINSSGKELFPFLKSDSEMYFSSDHHGGLGGLDIFKAVHVDSTTWHIENLGSPFNSNRDDFDIFFTEDNAGFFASNRIGGKGGDDIYRFQTEHSRLNVIVKDFTTNKAVHQPSFKVINSDQTFNLYKGNWDGEITLELEGVDFNVIVSDPNYISSNNTIQLPYNHEDTTIILYLKRQRNQFIKGRILNEKSKELIEGVTVKINKEDKLSDLVVSDGEGEFGLPIGDVPITIIFEKNGYLIHKKVLELNSLDPIIKKDFLITPIEDQMRVNVAPIYFPYDEYTLTPNAEYILDELVAVMNMNPDLNIEMGSHTDKRGTINYNEDLSRKRSIETFSYLVKKGIDKNRLVHNFYGESKLAYDCAEQTCSEREHFLNRRTEFRIITE